MLARALFTISCIFAALVLEAAMPILFPPLAGVRLTDLSIAVVCLLWTGGPAVAWAGLAGLSSDLLHHSEPGWGCVAAATCSLAVLCISPRRSGELRMGAALVTGVVLITLLTASRVVVIVLEGTPSSPLVWTRAIDSWVGCNAGWCLVLMIRAGFRELLSRGHATGAYDLT